MTSTMAKVLKEHTCCELCGSKRSLEAHHILPRSLGGPDEPDNILCVCKKCHALLTPRSELIKFGQKKEHLFNYIFYRHFEDYDGDFDWRDIMDYLDEIIFPLANLYYCLCLENQKLSSTSLERLKLIEDAVLLDMKFSQRDEGNV